MSRAALLTMLTDYLLAAAATVCAALLVYHVRRERRHEISMLWWAGAFVAVAIAAIAGGTYHGFESRLSEGLSGALWKLTVYAAGGFTFAALTGSIIGCVSGQIRTRLLAANAALLLVYAVWMTTHDDFRYVVYNSIAAMFAILALHGGYRNRDPSTPWMIAAVMVSALAAGIQASGVEFRYVGHNDLYHLAQIVGLYLFYRGAALLSDRGLV